MPEAPPTRVFLRPIGSPLAIGMSGLAIASLVDSGDQLSWIAKSQTVEVGLILLAVPFILQLVASILSYLARDGSAGTCTGILSTTWLALGLVHIGSGSGASGALGLLLLASGGVLALSALSVSVGKLLPGATFMSAALHFAVGGIYELSSNGAWQEAAGIIGLVVCALAAYCVLAFELEGEQRRPVLPTLRRGRGEVAIQGEWPRQVEEVASEAGVRQMS